MDNSAQDTVPSGTKEPDTEDNKDIDEDADVAKDGRTRKTTDVLEQICLQGEKISKDGLYRWTCCVTVVHPFYLGVPPRFQV